MVDAEKYKQALIDLLSKESPQVLQVAYIYAKHYVDYGEDITKAWDTAVQQSAIIQKVRQKAWTEAYDSFIADSETRMKYINALRKCAKEHENDRTSMGHIIVSDLCRDTADLLEQKSHEEVIK